MANPFEALHFSTILPGEAFLRFARRLTNDGVEAVYDLEDTHWDPLDRTRTARRRHDARRNLQALISGLSRDKRCDRLSVRVNSSDTPDLVKDLEALAGVPVPIHAVVLPKVNSAESIRSFAELAGSHGLAPAEIVPILETDRAIRSLPAIIEGIHSTGVPVRRVMFGAFDYCLDCGIWPFLRQDSTEFQSLTQRLCESIEGAGFEYVHTPFAQVREDEALLGVIGRLSRICSHRFWVSTLTRSQLGVVEAARSGIAISPCQSQRAARVDERRLAAETVAAFEAAGRPTSRGRDYGFVLDSQSGRFISPHEYVAARAFLERACTPSA